MLKKHQAGVGDFYDAVADVFYQPSPYPSWTLNTTTYEWEPPVPHPGYDDKKYYWNEETQQWIFLRNYTTNK
jgi:hypothetical protein